jgi:hypothetical protein
MMAAANTRIRAPPRLGEGYMRSSKELSPAALEICTRCCHIPEHEEVGDPMSIEISHEIEKRLADEAKRLGISVNTLLERFIDERARLIQPAVTNPGLPLWHLGSAGALHRRDIYDDAR